MRHKLTQNLVSQSVSQTDRQTDRQTDGQSLIDSKSCVKSEISENAVEIC